MTITTTIHTNATIPAILTIVHYLHHHHNLTTSTSTWLPRMAEFTDRCFNYAQMERGPVQLNIPRDHFYGDVQVCCSVV